jgi:hypothetical protein
MFDTSIHTAAQAPLTEKVICIEWRPCERNTLRGFAKIKIPAWSLVIDGVAIHKRDERQWAQLPSRPQIDKDGTVLREDDGKVKYAKIMEIDDKAKAWAFSDEVVAAVARKLAAVSELNNGGLASAGPSVLGCALAFARRGHAVLLLYGISDGKCDCGKDCGKNAGKHPHHACPNGVHSATTDQDVIRGWFAKYPTSNYGICTDTLPTVDIDPRNGGDKSWRDLVRKNYDVVGWRVRTGGGGEHIMFGTVSAPLPSCVLAKGVEFQSAGKYIVGVGSLHMSGKRYIWDKSAMPERDQMSPSAPPPWLVTLITESKVKPKAVRSPLGKRRLRRLPARAGRKRQQT